MTAAMELPIGTCHTKDMICLYKLQKWCYFCNEQLGHHMPGIVNHTSLLLDRAEAAASRLQRNIVYGIVSR